jgi:hypothetical protein
MDTLVDEKRCMGVAQIVEPALGQTVVLADSLKPAQDIALFEWCFCLRWSGLWSKLRV